MQNRNRSTGLRAEEGKARSSQNARKHGLSAEKVVITPEEQAKFANLKAELDDEIGPEGLMEQLLFEQMVYAAWKLRKVRAIESQLVSGDLQDQETLAYLERLSRYAARAEHSYFRSLKEIRVLRDRRAAGRKAIEKEMTKRTPPPVSPAPPDLTLHAEAWQEEAANRRQPGPNAPAIVSAAQTRRPAPRNVPGGSAA